MAKHRWIKSAIKHPGGLHRALGVPSGEKIPAAKVEKASHSANPHLAKMANLAKTLGGMHHAKGGKVKHVGRYAQGGQVGDRQVSSEDSGRMSPDQVAQVEDQFRQQEKDEAAISHARSQGKMSVDLGGGRSIKDLQKAHGGAITHLAKAAARYGAKTVRRPA